VNISNQGQSVDSLTNFTQTFDSDFAGSGLSKFARKQFPWNQETRINGEYQFYPNTVGQFSTYPGTVNNGVLELRVVPTPPGELSNAKYVVRGYIVNSVSGNTLNVQATSYWNPFTKTSQVGIHHDIPASGTVRVESTVYNYTSFSNAGGDTYNFQLSGSPSGSAVGTYANFFMEAPFLGCLLTTQDSWAQERGRFVARMKMPAGNWLFPAFWLLPDGPVGNWSIPGEGDVKSEIDIIEMLGHSPEIAYFTAHDNNAAQPQDQYQYYNTAASQGGTIDFSNAYHDYGIDWTLDDQLIWHVDGIEMCRTPVPPTMKDGQGDARFILLNLAYKAEWPVGQRLNDISKGYDRPVDENNLPPLLVEYVKAYQYTVAGTPYISAPTPSSTLSSSNAQFSWTANGATGINSWRLTIGSSPGATNYYDSGVLAANALTVSVSNLPIDGSTLHSRLIYNDGSNNNIDAQYTAWDNPGGPIPSNVYLSHGVSMLPVREFGGKKISIPWFPS